MANICSFSMQVKGERENIEKFYNALTQKENTWMGRGAEADIAYDDKSKSASIDGWCKWSIEAALVLDAKSMRKQKETHNGRWYADENFYNRDYLTIFEACKKFNVNMEVYSEEAGCEFQEHYKYENGKILSDCVDYHEYYYDRDEFETFEDFKKEYGLNVEDTGEDYYHTGGYGEWYFDLADVK